MDLPKILTQLREERERVLEAIAIFERLAMSGRWGLSAGAGQTPAGLTLIQGKRRGRPLGSKPKASAHQLRQLKEANQAHSPRG
jgi:hypothetical protein